MQVCCNSMLTNLALTSDTLRPASLLIFVRLAELLKTLAMPIPGRILWRRYDCSILNLGMLTSSLLWTRHGQPCWVDSDMSRYFQVCCWMRLQHLSKADVIFALIAKIQQNTFNKIGEKLKNDNLTFFHIKTYVLYSFLTQLRNLSAEISSSITV